MQNYLDEICLLLLCGIFSVTHVSSMYAIVGLLMAVIVVCAQSFDSRIARVTTLVVFIVTACTSYATFGFLALAAYAAMHERSWVVRALWVVPLCVQAVIAGSVTVPLLWVVALCLVGCALGIKDVRRVSEYRGLQRAYDSLKEKSYSMAPQTREGAVGQQDVVGTDGARAACTTPAAQAAQATCATSGSSFFEGLTERELAVVDLVAEGMDNREISQKLFLSEGTVRNHISSILSKKNLQNRTQIAVMYYRN